VIQYFSLILDNSCFTNPCLNGGKCQVVSSYTGVSYTCSCASGYYGNNCQYCKNNNF